MSKTLTARATCQVQYTYKEVDAIGNTTKQAERAGGDTTFADGDAANQMEIMYSNRLTLTAGSPNQDLDLYGTLTDYFGDTINMEFVRAILVWNRSTTAGDDIYWGPLSQANGFAHPWGTDNDGYSRVRASGKDYKEAPLDGFKVESDEQILRFQYQGTSGSINVDVYIWGTVGDLESSSSSSSSSASSSSSSSSSVGVSSSSSSSSVQVSSSSSSSSQSSSSQSSGGSSASSSSSSSVAYSSSSSSSSQSSQG